MFFGLTNSPATFQTMMNVIFKDEIDKGSIIIYMDDVLIFTPTLKKHYEMVKYVLKKFRENKLFLKQEKCTFKQNKVEYLGLIVLHNKVHMDPIKIQGIKEWPFPKSKRDRQQFLGFTNFYKQFIKGYANTAKPLTEPTGKKDRTWMEQQTNTFEKIKSRITLASVLAMPRENENGQYQMEVDSSNFATRGILSQKQEDNSWKPIAFISNALNKTEHNYEIYNKEMLAIIRGLDQWQQYLLGATKIFEIYTDHKNLEYFKKPQKLNQ